MDELQEMREQMAALKEKLDKQEIVSENNLRKLLGEKIKSWRNLLAIGIIFVVLITIAIGVFDEIDFVWYGVLIYAIISYIFEFRKLRYLREKDIMSGDLKSVLSRLRHLRKSEKGPWIFRGMGILFILYFADYIIKRFQMKAGFCKWDLLVIFVLCFFSLLDYLFWKFYHQKQPSQWDEYIRQLEEIPELDEEKEEEREKK